MTIPTVQKPLVTCYCDTDLVHSSYAVTGLIELADAGEISLQFRLNDPRVSRPRGMWAFWLRITTESHFEQGVCIDCHDAPEYFCPDGLAACRLYYKSNLRQATYAAVPAEYREKLRPFGPYLPCRPRRDRAALLRRLGNAYTKLRHLSFVSTKKRTWLEKLRVLYGALTRYKRYMSRKIWCEYELLDRDSWPDRPMIHFNPTCWDEGESPEIRPMNEMRARLIVALRREFGDQFVGGFRNQGPSVAGYPEAVEPYEVPHDEYVRSLHASPITVYVNGKWRCFSWRLAENLAAGQGMISERIVNDAGFPLDESAGIVQRDTVEEMVESLRRISESPQCMRQLSESSRRAYVEHVRPTVRMRRLINDVLDCQREATDDRSTVDLDVPRSPETPHCATKHARSE